MPAVPNARWRPPRARRSSSSKYRIGCRHARHGNRHRHPEPEGRHRR
jgi:hypothetical protein